MTERSERARARDPQDLSRMFVERANAGDVEGMVELYEPNAVLASPPGALSAGADAIRRAYAQLLSTKPVFTPGAAQPPLVAGELALTSTLLADGTLTVEVARRQPDGTWLWVIDQPRAARA